MVSLPERFWNKVDKTDTCWLWTASLRNGYGEFRLTPDATMKSAHRVAYELLVGPIPEDRILHHTCGVRRCVNPAHLEAVFYDEHAAIHNTKTTCKHGHVYDEENTYINPSGHRACRKCHRDRERERQRRIRSHA